MVETKCYLIELSEHSRRMPIPMETNHVLKTCSCQKSQKHGERRGGIKVGGAEKVVGSVRDRS